MKYPQFAVVLASFALLTTAMPSRAQDTGGFKGFLKRTAGAVMGQPSTQEGASANGRTVTDGAVYRPISPASGGMFPNIFRGWTFVNNKAKFPRVSLYFETFGASEACWRTRAMIWTSETAHREEVFDLCNAPVMTHDDLGATTVMADPTTTYLRKLSEEIFSPGITVTADRTVGPNPPRVPFLMDFGSAPVPLRGQYQDIVVRAMIVSGYATAPQQPLFWVGGFNPNGIKDARHD